MISLFVFICNNNAKRTKDIINDDDRRASNEITRKYYD